MVTVCTYVFFFFFFFFTMNVIFYKLFNFSGIITALSGFLFIGTHCILHNVMDRGGSRIFIWWGEGGGGRK